MVINCPKCGKKTEFKLHDAVDELGEIFKCKYCGYLFRFVNK